MGFAVSLSGVSKNYLSDRRQVRALDEVILSVDPAAVVAVTGPSGSGKSTLLHVIGAMDRPDSGSVRVAGREVSSLSRREQAAYRRKIGFVFQRFHLLPALSAIDNVIAPVLPYRTDFDRVARARGLIEAVGLAGKELSPPARLSGGEQQRVAIARALINDPGLLLADEPTGSLDSETGEDIVQLLVDLRRERGMTVMIATHNQVVATLCDRIVRLQDGRIVDDIQLPPSLDTEEVFRRISGLEPGT